MKNIYSQGFTVGEVLITLLVLGILFSLTVPTIMRNHQRNTTQAGFTDFFKEFNKAIFNYSVKKQCQGKLSCTGLFSNIQNIENELAPMFRATKVGTNCWQGKKIVNNIDGSGSTTDLNSKNCFVDAKNRIYVIEKISADCTTDFYNSTNDTRTTKKHKLQKSCGYLIVDINGVKAPNTFGIDVFPFVVTDAVAAYLYPVGGSLSKASYAGLSSWKGTCGDGNLEGRTCGGRIIEEGWKVKYLK